VDSASGTNTVVVEATDPSSNTRTNTYEVEVSGTGTTYEHDANGNLIEKDDGTDAWTYEWNAENRLTDVLKNAQTVATFSYDPLGRRVEKVAGATTTTFTYDWEDIVRETAGGATVYYVHGSGLDEPLAGINGATMVYYHADGLGSVLKITDANGDVVHEYRYDSFGRLELGSSRHGYSFTGREWDPEIELYYYRFRYYDAEGGRFINEDPIRLAGGVNLFRYVRNNPVIFVDHFGLLDPCGGRFGIYGPEAYGQLKNGVKEGLVQEYGNQRSAEEIEETAGELAYELGPLDASNLRDMTERKDENGNPSPDVDGIRKLLEETYQKIEKRKPEDREKRRKKRKEKEAKCQ
jgi:RHS repeat-associated protein